jgi:hypothetical protein
MRSTVVALGLENVNCSLLVARVGFEATRGSDQDRYEGPQQYVVEDKAGEE